MTSDEMNYEERVQMPLEPSLAFITKKTDPLELFNEWREEASKFIKTDYFCLSTVSKDLEISSRNLVVRRIDTDGFVFTTDNRSRKVQDLKEVPNVSMCFLWAYENENKQYVTRQIRVNGTVEELPRNESEILYNKEPMYCKIRSYLGPQGKKIEWENQLDEFKKIKSEVKKGRILPVPEHFVGYKIIPRTMEFYFAYDDAIADRMLFTQESNSKHWSRSKLAA